MDPLAPHPRLPVTITELLCRPVTPPVAVIQRATLEAAGGLAARHRALTIWELLIRIATGPYGLVASDAPIALTAETSLGPHGLDGYVAHVAATRPELLDELPNATLEWDRLRFTLHAQIIAEHRGLFAQHLEAILPELSITDPAQKAPPAPPPTYRAARQLWALLERRHPPAPLRRAVRGLWPLVRRGLRPETRIRYYRRYRAVYEQFFPERRPPRRPW
jgi:hypothetical protein